MDLRKLSESELQTIKMFAEKLLETNQQNGLTNFDDVDIAGAEIQAKNFLARQKEGYKNSEFEGDADIRASVRNFLSKRNLIKKEADKDTGYLSTTRPNY